MQFKSFMEALKGKQHKIDKNKNGKIDAQDFKMLQKEEQEVDESLSPGWMLKADPKLAAALKAKTDLAKKRQASYGNPAAGVSVKPVKEELEEDLEEKFDALKHVKNPTKGEKEAAKDVKRGSYADRAALLRSAEKEDRLKEAKMSDADTAERERIVKGMKKNLASFKSKYGARAKDVMYATATKMAMKEELDEKLSVVASGGTNKVKKDEKTGVSSGTFDKSPPFDGPYSKPGKPGGSMNRARTLARQGMKQAMKEEFDLDITDEQADEIFEAVQKADIPAYLRKQRGDAPLKLSDLKRKDTLSDLENLKRANSGVKEEVEELDEKSEQAKRNKTMKNMMDASRGARFKVNNPQSMTPKPDTGHKTPRAHNVAIGRALRNEDNELEEQHPIAPVPGQRSAKYAVMVHPETKQRVTIERKNAKNYPEHEGWKEVGPGQKIKENFDNEGNIIPSQISYQEFAMMLEYETKDGVYKHKGTYGGNYVDPEGADDADDKKKPAPAAEKRGRGRPAGAKSGARKITGTSKLFK